MSEDSTRDPDGAALWRRLRPGLQREGERLDPLVLAGYLDATLDARERERVEALLCASVEALDVVLASRAALAAVPGPAPGRLQRRARALVPRPAWRLTASWRRFLPSLPLWQQGAVAVAVLLASVSGFEIGRSSYSNVVAVETALVQVVDLGLLQLSEDPL